MPVRPANLNIDAAPTELPRKRRPTYKYFAPTEQGHRESFELPTTAVHVIRLILGGVFDQYPNLQIVIGHLGEGLPFMLQRLDEIAIN